MPPSLRYAKISLRSFTNKTSQCTHCFYFFINLFTCLQCINLTETTLSNVFKYIQMSKPNQIAFLIPYSFWPLQHLALLTTCFLLVSFSALDIQNSVSTHLTTSYLLFLSFLTKQHFFLPSPKCGYVPRLELWFLVLLFDSNNNEGMNHSHIPYTQPENTNNIMSRATKEKNLEWTIRRYLKLGGKIGLMEKGRHREKRRN